MVQGRFEPIPTGGNRLVQPIKDIAEELTGDTRIPCFSDIQDLVLMERDGSCMTQRPSAIACPGSEGELAMVMAWCSTRGIALAVRGGGTGQSGAALTKGLVVNLERHFRYTHLAEDASTIRVGAATTISQIENELNPRGRTLGLDLHVQNRSAGGLFNSQPAVEPSSGTNFIDLISSMTWILPSGQVVKLAPATNDNQNPWPDTLLNTIEPIFSPIRFTNSKMPGPSPSVFPTNGRPWSWLAGTLGKCGAGSEFIIRTRPRHEHIRTLLVSSTSLADLEEQAERLNGLKPTHSILLDRRTIRLARAHSNKPWLTWCDHQGQWSLLVFFECSDPVHADWITNQASNPSMTRQIIFAPDSIMLPSPNAAITDIRKGIMGSGSALTWRAGWTDFLIPYGLTSKTIEAIGELLKKREITAGWEVHLNRGRLRLWPLSLGDDSDESISVLTETGREIAAICLGMGGGFGLDHGLGPARESWKSLLPPQLQQFHNELPILLNQNVASLNAPEEPEYSPPIKQSITNIHELSGASKCTGCGDCRSVTGTRRFCPMNRVMGTEESTPRAKAALAHWLATDPKADPGSDQSLKISELCIQCRMCESECPASLDVPSWMLAIRKEHVRRHGLDRSTWLIGQIEHLSALANRFAPLINPLMRSKPFRWILEKTFGLSRKRKPPRFAGITFLAIANRNGWTRPIKSAKQKVAYFVDVFANLHDPSIGEAFVRLLQHLGIDVHVPPEQVGSGMHALVQGDFEGATEACKRHVHVFSELAREGYPIVCTEPTAALFLQKELPKLMPGEDSRIIASQTIEATHYLSELGMIGNWSTQSPDNPISVSHHVPCHIKALGKSPAGPELLVKGGGFNVETLDVSCSGMAGPWGMLATNYESSLAAGEPMLSLWKNSSSTHGSTECSSCRLQMEHVTSRPVRHPVQLLAWSLGLVSLNGMPKIRKQHK